MRLVILWLLAATAIAHGDPDPAAARLFEAGRVAAKAGNYGEACAKFTRSLELDPAVGTELNLADCIEHQGMTSRAWKLFDDVATRSEHDNPVRAKFARDRADALLPRLATIVIEVADPDAAGLTITIADQQVPVAAEHTERVEPGQLKVVAAIPGKRFARTVQAVAGGTLTISIPALVARVATPDAPGTPRRQRGRVYLAAAVAGVGVAGLVFASAVGLGARSLYQDQIDSGACHEGTGSLTCTPQGAAQVDLAARNADLSTYVFIGSALLVAAGVTLYFTAPREQVVTVAPVVSTTGIGLALVTRF